MRKYLVAAILVIAIGVVLSAVFFRKAKDGAGFGGEGIPAPAINPGIVFAFPQEEYVVIGTSSGVVRVKNFYKAAEKVIEQTEIVIKETPEYLFLYHAASGDFELRVLGKSPRSSRARAEEELLRLLGLSQEEACKLQVSVSVPYGADPLLKGGIYPLSFCL